MPYQHLLVDRDEHVAIITLNRPERLNALNSVLWDEICEVAEEMRADDDVRAVVFTGAGRGFCSGADITPRPKPGDNSNNEPSLTRDELLDEYGRIGRQALTIYQRLDKPTIAAVNGPAAGAGYSLSLACDLRTGSAQTRFKTIFLERNIATDSGMSYFLPRIVGYSRALDLIYSSRWVESEEAYRIGLIDRVYPAETLVEDSIKLAKEMSAWPPVATQMAKRVLQHSMNSSLEDQLRFESQVLTMTRRSTNDQAESRDFRLEKRAPKFTGS